MTATDAIQSQRFIVDSFRTSPAAKQIPTPGHVLKLLN